MNCELNFSYVPVERIEDRLGRTVDPSTARFLGVLTNMTVGDGEIKAHCVAGFAHGHRELIITENVNSIFRPRGLRGYKSIGMFGNIWNTWIDKPVDNPNDLVGVVSVHGCPYSLSRRKTLDSADMALNAVARQMAHGLVELRQQPAENLVVNNDQLEADFTPTILLPYRSTAQPNFMDKIKDLIG